MSVFSPRARFTIRPVALALGLAFSPWATANPTLPTLVNGQASIQTIGNTLAVKTSTTRTIINWQSFSINSGEVTRFDQPSPTSAVLNRVTGQNPSQLLGILESNGRVMLINPAGIVVGKDAQINVAGLALSALPLADADFMANRFNFQGPGGDVTQDGTINAAGGAVLLIGGSVTNSGLIQAPGGQVVLAAGQSVTLAELGTPNITVTLQSPVGQATNLGKILNDGGSSRIYGALVRQGGLVRTNSGDTTTDGSLILDAGQRVELLAGGHLDTRKVALRAPEIVLRGGIYAAEGASIQAANNLILDGIVVDGPNVQVNSPNLGYTGPGPFPRSGALNTNTTVVNDVVRTALPPPPVNPAPTGTVTNPLPLPGTAPLMPPPGGMAPQPGITVNGMPGAPGPMPPTNVIGPPPGGPAPLNPPPTSGMPQGPTPTGTMGTPGPMGPAPLSGSPMPPPAGMGAGSGDLLLTAPLMAPPPQGAPISTGNSNGNPMPGGLAMAQPTAAPPLNNPATGQTNMVGAQPVLVQPTNAPLPQGQLQSQPQGPQLAQGGTPTVGAGPQQPAGQPGTPNQPNQPNQPGQPGQPGQPEKGAGNDNAGKKPLPAGPGDKGPESKGPENKGKPDEARDKAGQNAGDGGAGAKGRPDNSQAFGRIKVSGLDGASARALVAERHAIKAEAFKSALSSLDANPQAADLPACGSGVSGLCMALAREQAATASSTPRHPQPKESHLPRIGRKIALLIGNDRYQDAAIPPLESAGADAQAVGNVMAERLGYEVRVLRDATKTDIVQALNQLTGEVGPNDSVTLYYAGHGYLSEKNQAGYWLPVDAAAKQPDNWISNSDIAKYLANIPAKQVMLVSDSCFSGSLTREQKVGSGLTASDPNAILDRRSVVVLSSGGEEPVSDEGKDGHSIFAWHLMKALNNVSKWSPGTGLYRQVRDEVSKEFPQEPQYGASLSAGHQLGGDYLLERRRYR